jgi:thymidylate kinase
MAGAGVGSVIVCLEGVNGCGKTTLAGALTSWWSGPAEVADPVQATGFGRHVRSAIMDAAGLTADAETLAFVSARLDGATALDGVAHDGLLVLERWGGAVVAYGSVAGSNPFLLNSLESVLAGALPVDLTILIDVPGTVAASRLASMEEAANRFETIGPDYLEHVRRSYLAWATMRHVPVIAGTDPTEQQLHTIRDLITLRTTHRPKEKV